MTEVVVFHHALGLTPGVIDFAEAIASAGYEVHTPDLFDGKRFAEVEDGAAHAQSIGLGTIVERGMAASSATAQLYLYPGDAHLFAESGARGFSPGAAGLLMSRVLALLSRVS